MQDDPDNWTMADAVALRTFIADNPKFVRVLAKRRPKIEGSTMESRAVTGSDANGFMLALEEVDAMQRDPVGQSDDAGFIKS